VATVTNAAVNLQIRLDACKDKFKTKYGQDVINLLVVDFWSVGDTLEVVNKYNSALPARTSTPSSAPTPTPTKLLGSDAIEPPISTTDVDSTSEKEEEAATLNPSRKPITGAPTKQPTSFATLYPTTSTSTVATTEETSYPTAAPTASTSTVTTTEKTSYPTTVSTNTPTLTPSTLAPSGAPSLSLATLFDTIINGPLETTPPAVENPSDHSNGMESLNEDIDFVSSIGATSWPTFATTEEPLPQVEKERPDIMDPLLSSAFDYDRETLGPTTEDTDISWK
jgi:hypothetical protein